MSPRSKKITVRVTQAEAAAIKTRARELGQTTNDFVVSRALATITQDALAAGVVARIDGLESALAEALDARDAALRESLAERFKAAGKAQTRNFQTLGDWLAKRLPRQHRRPSPGPATVAADARGEPEDEAAEALRALPEGDQEDA